MWKRLGAEKDIISKKTCKFTEKEICDFLDYVDNVIFAKENTLLDLDGTVTVAGDIHGQLPDLLRLFNEHGCPPDQKYLFLGDYVDRGLYGLEVLLLLLAMKVLYSERTFILRGNHEEAEPNMQYGFYKECMTNFLFSTLVEIH